MCNFVVVGNFNFINVDELFDVLVDIGQYLKEKLDMVMVLEKIGYYFDVENEELIVELEGQVKSVVGLYEQIVEKMSIEWILKWFFEDWDGGYVMVGLFGYGDVFVLCDLNGICLVFWYEDDEVVVVVFE